jgi:hypothetical protein
MSLNLSPRHGRFLCPATLASMNLPTNF